MERVLLEGRGTSGIPQYILNLFYLDFSDNSAATATTLGKDRSGNDNNFTPSNFSVSSGPGNDSLPDTPSNNFCTMNPLVPTPSTTWANGNLDLSGGTSDTNLGNSNWGFGSQFDQGDASQASNSGIFLDSPSSTAQLTYKLYHRAHNGTAYSCINSGKAGMIRYEVVA